MSLEEDIPYEVLLNNPNGLLALSSYGAHCDLIAEDKETGKTKRFYPNIVLKYINEISKFN